MIEPGEHKKFLVTVSSLFLVIVMCGQQPRLVFPIGHTGPIISATFSPDGKKILTGSMDNTTKIWDANTATLLANYNENAGFDQAYYSTDAKKIITITHNQMVVRDAVTGEQLQTELYVDMDGATSISPDRTKIILSSFEWIKIINIQTGAIQKTIPYDDLLSFSSVSYDNKYLATKTTLDPTVKIWDINTGRIIRTLKGHSSDINAVIFSPKGHFILTVSYDNTAEIWDAKNGNLLRTLSGHTKSVRSGNFSSDEKMVITGAEDGTAKIWNTYTGALLGTLNANTVWGIDDVNFSPDNKKVIMSSGYTAKIWDVASKTLLKELQGKTKDITAVLFSVDLKSLFTVSDDKTVNVWDKEKGIIKKSWETNLVPENNNKKDIRLSPDGQRLLTIENEARTIRNRNIETGRMIFEKEIKKTMFVDANYSPDGKKIITTLNNGTFLILDAATGDILHEIKDPGAFTETIQFSPDNKTFVDASWDSTATIWNAQTGEKLHILSGHSGSVYQAVYSADGKKIMTVALPHNYQAYVWDAENGKQLHSFAETPFICFSNDYKTILLQGEKDTTIVWDITLQKPIYKWVNAEFTSRPDDFIIANDKLIITRGFGGSFRTTNIRTGEMMYELKDEEEGAKITGKAVFSPDGKEILTISHDNTCKILNSENGELLYTFFMVDSSDYMLQIPTGYYQASSNASKTLHYVTSDLKVITFEQLDVKYNRPDKVLEAIGSTDTALIKSYRKAWEKRIRKLGIDTTAFIDGYSVPKADFANRNEIEYEQKTGLLRIIIKANDSVYTLDRFNIWVNETPLYGQRGISIKKKKTNSIDTTITIKLSQGENRIETSITNVNGTE
ncbi:MAG: hypothetical protein ABIP79_16345, partial [Chitinophagaceae bacterium]